jgi:enterobactin synthetase component D
MSTIVSSREATGWVRPPPIFGLKVHARATTDMSLPLGTLPAGFTSRSPKRIRELAVGRRCAAEALRGAGATELTVGFGAVRDPQWPSGFVGSITHTSSFACAAVARSADLRGLGIDSEFIFDESAMEEAVPLALDAGERRLTEGRYSRELATLIFSAKESLFKCLYPLVRVFFEFVDARVEWIARAEPSSGTFGVYLRRDLAAGIGSGLRLGGRYALAEDHVHTALELGR